MANRDYIDDNYRSLPDRPGPANDPAAIRKLNLKKDQVTVVHSAETDPMPNEEAQEAYAEEDSEIRSRLYQEDSVNPTDAAPAPVDDDLDDFESQQERAELAGPERKSKKPAAS